ncbi:hypothetical protein JTB14_027457 [Gonioctena quinquepunctata]|nr:hypothetical protein JTB14_027457 [Gonioctena quinquepunctata]
MISFILLLIWNLSLVNSGATTSINKHGNIVAKSNISNDDLHLINDYFKRTTITNNNQTEIHYNETTPKLRISKRQVPGIHELDQLIASYSSSSHVMAYTKNDWNDPITNYGIILLNNNQKLPLYQIADIRKRHLPAPNSRKNFGSDVEQQMRLMGMLRTDDRGHLLAHSLGGSSTALNIIPMTKNVNRNCERLPGNRELGLPTSYWRSNEDYIRRFLYRDYPGGRVTWRIALKYKDNVLNNPQRANDYRPLRFTMQFTCYTNENDPNSKHHESAAITYWNDDSYACAYEEKE